MKQSCLLLSRIWVQLQGSKAYEICEIFFSVPFLHPQPKRSRMISCFLFSFLFEHWDGKVREIAWGLINGMWVPQHVTSAEDFYFQDFVKGFSLDICRQVRIFSALRFPETLKIAFSFCWLVLKNLIKTFQLLSDLGSQRVSLEDPGIMMLLALHPLDWACLAVGSHTGVVMFLEVFCPTSVWICLFTFHMSSRSAFLPASPKIMFSASCFIFLGPTPFSSILPDLIETSSAWGAPLPSLLCWQVHNCVLHRTGLEIVLVPRVSHLTRLQKELPRLCAQDSGETWLCPTPVICHV